MKCLRCVAVSVFARVGCNDQHEFGIVKLFGASYFSEFNRFVVFACEAF